jgi:oligosaccharide reducing-end xylanase
LGTLSGLARWTRTLGRAALAASLAGCGSTTDSLGSDEFTFRPLDPPEKYPNAFRDVLPKTEREIDDKLRAAYAALFEGDEATQAIYFEEGGDRGFIKDIFHDDVRTEGMGYGMMIAVQLDKPEVFERLWRHAKTEIQYTSGPRRGYFPSSCNTGTAMIANWTPCVDPFGHQQMLMALLFASNRWGRKAKELDYVHDARALLEVMRSKEAENGGIQDNVTDMFDTATKLVFDVPELTAAGITRPSIEMPAFYQLWAQATGDAFWGEAATAARDHLKRTADPTTGFTPLRAHFNGDPVSAWAYFNPEGYRTQINWTIDHIWFAKDSWAADTTDKLLGFFAAQGVHGTSYTVEGAVIDDAPENALLLANGICAQITRISEQRAFLDAVWTFQIPTGTYRYYQGLLYLTALLILSGSYRVY